MAKVLVISAHADDEVFGCGGTLVKHAGAGDEIRCVFMTSPSSQVHGQGNKLAKERDAALAILGVCSWTALEFVDQGMDTYPDLELSRAVETEVGLFNPDIVYTHCPNDVNSDHRETYKAVMVACRPPRKITIRLFAIPGNNYHESFCWNESEDISGLPLKLKLRALRAYKSELRTGDQPRSIERISKITREAFFTIKGGT